MECWRQLPEPLIVLWPPEQNKKGCMNLYKHYFLLTNSNLFLISSPSLLSIFKNFRSNHQIKITSIFSSSSVSSCPTPLLPSPSTLLTHMIALLRYSTRLFRFNSVLEKFSFSNNVVLYNIFP